MNIQTKSRRRNGFLLYHLPVLAFAALVLGLSSIPQLWTPGAEIFGFDKLLHMGEYCVLGLLTIRSLSRFGRFARGRGLYWYSILLVAVFAVGDEFLQSFVPGRDSSAADFAADCVGAIIAVLLYRWLKKREWKIGVSFLYISR